MVAPNTLAGSIARKGLLRDYVAIMIGAFIMAVGLAVFLVDAKVVPGGVSGLSMAVHYLSGSRAPIGLTMWLFNIPLYIWGIRELGKQFGVRTLVGFTTNALFIDLLRGDLPGFRSVRLHEHPAIVNLRETDFLFLILVGSVLLGVGLGIIFKFRGTTAGSDVIAAVGQKRWGLKPGVVFMVVDSLVITFAGIAIHLRHLDTERRALEATIRQHEPRTALLERHDVRDAVIGALGLRPVNLGLILHLDAARLQQRHEKSDDLRSQTLVLSSRRRRHVQHPLPHFVVAIEPQLGSLLEPARGHVADDSTHEGNDSRLSVCGQPPGLRQLAAHTYYRR